MIASRERILELHDYLAAHLMRVQAAKYQPAQDWQEGESVILGDADEAVVLTKEQAEQMNQEDLQYYVDNKDNYAVKELNQWVGKATLISSKQEPQQYLNDLGQSLAELSDHFGELMILGDWNTPWLSQENEYVPVAKAIQFLKQKIDPDFNGGFMLHDQEIAAFIPHLFWLTRCNASLPEFMMAFKHSKTVFSICKYGVLHGDFYDLQEREKMMRFFSENNFQEVDRCSDPIVFDAFDGRRIKIDN